LSLNRKKLTQSVASDPNPNFDSIPNNFNLMKIYQTTFFCFACQFAFSVFLFLSFRKAPDYYVVNWKIQVARFMAACLIHFQFEGKATQALRMMKFVSVHGSYFEHPGLSWLFPFFQLIAVIFVELVNMQNLAFIGDIMDLVINYVALGAIFEFDENFYTMYSASNYTTFIDRSNEQEIFNVVNFIKRKIKLNYVNSNEKTNGFLPQESWEEMVALNYRPGADGVKGAIGDKDGAGADGVKDANGDKDGAGADGVKDANGDKDDTVIGVGDKDEGVEKKKTNALISGFKFTVAGVSDSVKEKSDSEQ